MSGSGPPESRASIAGSAAGSERGTTPTPFRRGELVAGKYFFEEVVGVGSTTLVASVLHAEVGGRLALKFLRHAYPPGEEIVTRFENEAQIAATVQSEHIARVYNLARLADGTPFAVMEFLRGQPLSVRLAAGPVPSETAVSYVLEACEALAVIHARGLVHGGVNLRNLFLALRDDGTEILKLRRLGAWTVPRAASSSGSKKTLMLGSPASLAPEQVRAVSDVDRRADVWALGCVAYELLTGNPPFDGPSVIQVTAAVLEGAPVPLRQLRPDVPAGLSDVIMRCLQKDRRQRFDDVAEFGAAIAPFAPPSARDSASRCAAILERSLRISPARAGRAATTGSTHPVVESIAPRGSEANRPLLRYGLFLLAGFAIGAAALLLPFGKPPSPDTGARPRVVAASVPPPTPVARTPAPTVVEPPVVSAEPKGVPEPVPVEAPPSRLVAPREERTTPVVTAIPVRRPTSPKPAASATAVSAGNPYAAPPSTAGTAPGRPTSVEQNPYVYH